MSLKRIAFAAGRWTAASATLVAGVQLSQTVLLARLILPADFGLMAVAAALLAILTLIADLGLTRALIYFDSTPPPALSSLYWLNFGMALVLALLLCFLAPAVGALYQSPALVPVLQVSSLMFPLTAAGQQFRALAEKELRFRTLTRIEIAAAVSGFCTAVAVALAGGGVYALVAGMLTRAAASSLLAWRWLTPVQRPSWHLSLEEVRPYLRFGSFAAGDSFANMIGREADVFVGGAVLTPAAMGIYAVPRELSQRLAAVVNPIITRVGFPVMSKARREQAKLKSVYLQTLRMTTSINFPIYVALALFAPEIVALLYGPHWRSAGTYLRVLAMWGLVRSTANPVGSLLYAVGRAKRAFWWNAGLLLLLPPLYWLAVNEYGLIGLALAMVFIQIALLLPAWRLLVLPSTGIGLGEFLRQIAVPLWLALAAGVMAWLSAHSLNHGTVRLLVGGITGGVTYLALSWLFNRMWATAVLELLHFKTTNSAEEG